MIYITGERESIDDIRAKEGFGNVSATYLDQLKKLNPKAIPVIASGSYVIPSYTPIYLVSETPSSLDRNPEIVSWFQDFSMSERKVVKAMQDSQHDIITQISMADILKEVQDSTNDLRKIYDSPLILTPWNDFNQSFKTSSLVDLFGQGAAFTGGYIRHSSRYIKLDLLSEHMYARDSLNTELYKLGKASGSKIIVQRKALQDAIKFHTGEIKKILPKRLDDTMCKYLRRVTPEEVRKIRTASYSKKIAKKGRISTTELDFLNKSGFDRLKKLIPRLNTIGDKVGKFSTYIGIGVVAYDTYEAYRSNGKIARTLFSGAVGGGVAYGLGTMASASTWGGLALGTLVGDAGLSAGVLLFMPIIGWVALTVAGLAVTGYVAYKASQAVETLWDKYGDDVCNEISSIATYVYNDVKSAWESGSRWILDFYGSKQ